MVRVKAFASEPNLRRLETRLSSLMAAFAFLASGCDGAVPPLDAAEQLPGGDTTNSLLSGNLAYSRPFENASRDDSDAFYSGNSFFTNPWVEGVSSTSARDGLGPLFNSRSCTGCHSRDGRGRPPLAGETVTGLLFRLSTGENSIESGPVPIPEYGGQLQPLAVDGVAPEGRVTIDYEIEERTYSDGETVELQRPRYTLVLDGFGAPTGDVAFSPRVAPSMIGMGLLENILESDVLALADPDDTDGDGISGRTQMTFSDARDSMQLGRFGWKAEKPTVRDQSAGAFAGDMGLTSGLVPRDDCTESQQSCLDSQSQVEAEVSDRVLDRVVTYSSMLAPPARPQYDTPELLEGRRHFYEVGCQSCHIPSFRTGTDHEISAVNDQLIWPYTDLLLHDMGEDLADHRPTWAADGLEWRTPPLWGLHALRAVNNHEQLLHDGRADGVEEAILWHGGEATQSREQFEALTANARAELVSFVESL